MESDSAEGLAQPEAVNRTPRGDEALGRRRDSRNRKPSRNAPGVQSENLAITRFCAVGSPVRMEDVFRTAVAESGACRVNREARPVEAVALKRHIDKFLNPT